MKLVPAAAPCVDANDSVPTQKAMSIHVDRIYPTFAGVTGLLPSNQLRSFTAQLSMTLPNVTAGQTANYKMCYRRFSFPWVEIDGEGTLQAITPPISRVALHADLWTTTSSSLEGVSRSVGVVAGTSTMWTLSTSPMVVGTVPYASSTSFLQAVGASAADNFKFVMKSSYDSLLKNRTCMDAAYDRVVQPVGDSIQTDFPIAPGYYLACYQSSATSAWLQLELVAQSDSTLYYPNPICRCGL